jgi:arginyl-tRNA synthetase
MDLVSQIKIITRAAVLEIYQHQLDADKILVNETKAEFTGDYTVVLFALSKLLSRPPESMGNELGQRMMLLDPGLVVGFNVVKGFLNLIVADSYWTGFLQSSYLNDHYGQAEKAGHRVMVEYSSPNTNKPLHLGHLRNNFLGWSVSQIYKANGYDTVKTCIANDRGIHICKSMVAWKLFAQGATPQSTGTKGDHFVGDYYVLFSVEHKKEVQQLVAAGMQREEAEKEAPIMKAAQQMLVDWESGVPAVIDLWKTMNSWVYAGFDQTYKRIGSDFDRIYYESETYLLGKDLVEDGLKKKVFFKQQDGSVWIDLTEDGLDQKIVQRKDGTAVYMTQDIGLIVNKFDEYHCDQSVYVVGDEQNYHFKVLQLIAQKLALPSANGIYHLSYGMVELPSGKMKTREGNVVDADEILDEMVREAERKTKEQGKTAGFTDQELKELYEIIGIGGLKFFLLRVDPKKRILFNPAESIDLHGYTATFIQYAHARIRSILRKQEESNQTAKPDPGFRMASTELLAAEKAVIKSLERYPAILTQARQELNPSLVASYAYDLTKSFNSFYTELSIMNAESAAKKTLRLQICLLAALVLKSSMAMLGIRVPERM